MKKVYVIIHNYCDGVEDWESISAIFERKDKAEFECYLYCENNEDPAVTYHVDEWDVN